MKTYEFIKGWMKGGRLTVSKDSTTYMYDKVGESMRFRQVNDWEIQDWLKMGLIAEI